MNSMGVRVVSLSASLQPACWLVRMPLHGMHKAVHCACRCMPPSLQPWLLCCQHDHLVRLDHQWPAAACSPKQPLMVTQAATPSVPGPRCCCWHVLPSYDAGMTQCHLVDPITPTAAPCFDAPLLQTPCVEASCVEAPYVDADVVRCHSVLQEAIEKTDANGKVLPEMVSRAATSAQPCRLKQLS